MSTPISAMATWIGALARGGLLVGHEEEEGALLAMKVLGESGLSDLRTYFANQSPDVVARERRGAIAACIWMAKADREIAEEEDELLGRLIAQSDLPFDSQRELMAAVTEPWPPERIATDLTQPGLRELMLALAWRVAQADSRLDPSEQSAYASLAEAFGIDRARATAIRELV